MNTYQDRNKLLKQLGYESYKEYLESPKWTADIRPRAMLRSGGHCMLCWKEAILIHHLGYGRKVLLGINLSPLIPLCSRCHWAVEHDSTGNKYSVAQSQQAYYRLRRRFRRSGEFADLPEQARRFLLHRCLTCGRKARKGSRYCTPCFLTKRGLPLKQSTPTSQLPQCKGKDCPCQAQRDNDYCAIHQIDPQMSYKDYKQFLRRARKSGLKVSVQDYVAKPDFRQPRQKGMPWYSR